ncbi:uncharacterized protein LOC142358761 isoform X2 [Convolutriloba macropyga]
MSTKTRSNSTSPRPGKQELNDKISGDVAVNVRTGHDQLRVNNHNVSKSGKNVSKSLQVQSLSPSATHDMPSYGIEYSRSKTDLRACDQRSKMQQLHDNLNEAIREKKVFLTSKGSSGKIIHRSLRKRSFIRKLDPMDNHVARFKGARDLTDTGYLRLSSDYTPRSIKSMGRLKDDSHGGDGGGDDSDRDRASDGGSVHSDDDTESVVEYMSKFVRNVTPSFIWTTKTNMTYVKRAGVNTFYNHFPTTASFTTKHGLTTTLKSVSWYGQVCEDEIYPRCYRIAIPEERQAFIEDFRLTACVAVITMATEAYQREQIQRRTLEAQQEKENILESTIDHPDNLEKDLNNSSNNNNNNSISNEDNSGQIKDDIKENISSPDGNFKELKFSDEVLIDKPSKREHDESVVLSLLNDEANRRPPSVSRRRPKSGKQSRSNNQLVYLDTAILEFAVKICAQYLREVDVGNLDEPDLDYGPDKFLGATESEWHGFTNNYYKLAQLVITILDTTKEPLIA